MEFAVWAPRAGTVALVLNGADFAMVAAGNGWWRTDISRAVDGDRYGFRLDGSEQIRADPRSRRQPDGVHQLSAVFDPGAHIWSDIDWTGRILPGSVIYELHVGTFTPAGTLDAAIDKLDHLVGLGVTAVELLPINAFNGTHNWGYDGVLWYAVHEGYGGPAGYQRFVDACHRRGLAVIQDVVYNHFGPSGNYLAEFGPYLSEGRANSWGTSVNLDGPDSDEVRDYIINNALMWVHDHHVDGLRLDAVHALADSRAVHILEEVAAEIEVAATQLNRPVSLIAESDLSDPRLITPREAGGFGLDGQWDDDFHHVVHVALTGETSGYYSDFDSMSAVGKVLQEAFFHTGTWSSFRGRRHGRPINVYSTAGWRFVVCLQNHDQVGNRAAGDRLSSTLSTEQLAVAAVLLYTSPFTPMLFMGEEWGAGTPWQFFTSHPEEELGRLTAEGRIAEFARMGWDPAAVPDPQDQATFERSKLDWTEPQREPHSRLLAIYRELAELRRAEPGLTDPRLDRSVADFDDAERTLSFLRGDLVVVVNLAAEQRTVRPVRPAGAPVFSTGVTVQVQGGSVQLPGHSAGIFRIAPRDHDGAPAVG